MKNSILIYESTFNVLRKMPPEEFKEQMCILADYVMKDTPFPDIDDPMLQMFYDLTKPLLDANIKKYENGKKGGRPTSETEAKPNNNQTITKRKPSNNQKKTKAKPNVHVNAPDKEKEHVNVQDKDNDTSSFGNSTSVEASEEVWMGEGE